MIEHQFLYTSRSGNFSDFFRFCMGFNNVTYKLLVPWVNTFSNCLGAM